MNSTSLLPETILLKYEISKDLVRNETIKLNMF